MITAPEPALAALEDGSFALQIFTTQQAVSTVQAAGREMAHKDPALSDTDKPKKRTRYLLIMAVSLRRQYSRQMRQEVLERHTGKASRSSRAN